MNTVCGDNVVTNYNAWTFDSSILDTDLESNMWGRNLSATSSRNHTMFMVIGINTAFNSRKRRDSVRQTWMPTGESPSLFCKASSYKHSRYFNPLLMQVRN